MDFAVRVARLGRVRYPEVKFVLIVDEGHADDNKFTHFFSHDNQQLRDFLVDFIEHRKVSTQVNVSVDGDRMKTSIETAIPLTIRSRSPSIRSHSPNIRSETTEPTPSNPRKRPSETPLMTRRSATSDDTSPTPPPVRKLRTANKAQSTVDSRPKRHSTRLSGIKCESRQSSTSPIIMSVGKRVTRHSIDGAKSPMKKTLRPQAPNSGQSYDRSGSESPKSAKSVKCNHCGSMASVVLKYRKIGKKRHQIRNINCMKCNKIKLLTSELKNSPQKDNATKRCPKCHKRTVIVRRFKSAKRGGKICYKWICKVESCARVLCPATKNQYCNLREGGEASVNQDLTTTPPSSITQLRPRGRPSALLITKERGVKCSHVTELNKSLTYALTQSDNLHASVSMSVRSLDDEQDLHALTMPLQQTKIRQNIANTCYLDNCHRQRVGIYVARDSMSVDWKCPKCTKVYGSWKYEHDHVDEPPVAASPPAKHSTKSCAKQPAKPATKLSTNTGVAVKQTTNSCVASSTPAKRVVPVSAPAKRIMNTVAPQVVTNCAPKSINVTKDVQNSIIHNEIRSPAKQHNSATSPETKLSHNGELCASNIANVCENSASSARREESISTISVAGRSSVDNFFRDVKQEPDVDADADVMFIE